MTATLAKGGNLLLADESPGITEVRVGMGWSAGPGSAAVEIDGIVSVVEGGPGGRLLLSHQVPNPDEPLAAHPAEGMPVGDAERLVVRLDAVPASVTRLTFGAAIYDAAARRQTFRAVRGAYIRVLNHANGVEVARYTLDVETGSETAMVFGELYRHARGWKFRAVGQGYAAGLRGIAGNADPDVMRPGDVTSYLRRISSARTRRSVTELLHPPAPARPAASAPAHAPRPATSQPSTSQPSTSQPPRPNVRHQPSTPPRATPPARPSASSPPATPPATPPASPPARPAARSRSSLDLSGPDPESAPVSTSRATRPAAGTASRNGGARGTGVAYGEHSSRRRQREEHVSVLDDAHRATTWTEQDRGSGGMTITLHWEPLKTSSGLPRPSDLHLGAFWQAGDRAEGVLQTLGNTISAPGAAGPRQVLRLGRRDEREGQTIFVDLATLSTFRRFFVYAYGQHGSPEWSLLRPELVLTAPSGQSLSMRFGDAPTSARLCVIASLHVVDDDLVIRRENDYVDGAQVAAAERYGWLLDWDPEGMTLRTSGRTAS